MRFAAIMLSGLFFVGDVTSQERSPQRSARFQQIFTVPGVEFTEEQRAKVEEFRKKYTAKLIDIAARRNKIHTPEQRKASQAALQAARDAGKQGRELREAADAAVQLSDEQRQELAQIQKEQRDLAETIQGELRELLTADQRRQLNQRRGAPRQRPTHANVSYGPHDRNVMDVWLAKSDKPTPILVSIHGGGFRGGNKSVEPSLLRECLDSGISVVAITYRLSDQAIAPAQHLDSARAIQFIRHNAPQWNVDPSRIAATGGSAGAGISLWLGFHDDLADPDNDDPVQRQSTRLTCMSVYNGQTSYDPRFIRDLFPGTGTYKHPALAQLYAVDLNKLDDLPEEKYQLFEQISAINYLTQDDVPAQLNYASQMDTPISSQGVGIHHPKFAQALKQKMDKLGIECQIHTGVRRGDDESTKLTMEFVKKHFGME